MEDIDDYQSFQQKVSAQLIATTRSAGQLAAEDLDFLRASDKKAGKRVDRKNGQLLDLAQKLINSSTQGTKLAPPELKKPSQIDEHWQSIADVIDNLLERADRCLDEYTGVITKLSKEKEQAIQEKSTSGRREGRTPRIHPLEKPQLQFRRVPKNDETTSFKPLLTSKPHAKIPLEKCLEPSVSENGSADYLHPYEQEIKDYKYPISVYTQSEPTPPNEDPESKTLTWVDTPEQVQAMLQDLKQAKEIAVDLEHHDTHTYVGLVCLMQISTRDKDWIVDTLKPWRESLQVLNQVFADPSILKVLHGSTMDIIWLQRDLGLYIVGLFDTYHATNALEYPRHGLAYLLKKFEDFDAQKQYQMADWRTRPLNKEMIEYARSDTHFLLHVFDCMRNELVEQSTPGENLVDYVLEKSKMEALQKYERFIYNAEQGFGANGWLGLLLRTPVTFNSQQFAVFKAVHQLRDKIARRVDESLLAVMRNDTIFALARTMPEEMSDLIGTINPVTQFMQPKMSELLGVIKSAKAAGKSGPSLEEALNDPEILAYQEQTGLSKMRRRMEKKAAQAAKATSTPALADIIRTEREKIDEAPNVAEGSSFWGDTLQGAGTYGPSLDLRLKVPLPEVGAQGDLHSDRVADMAGKITARGVQVTTDTEGASVQSLSAPNATFSIKDVKQQSRKRKAEAAEDSATSKAQSTEPTSKEHTEGSAGTPSANETDTQRDAKATEKAAKKARKAEKKAREEAEKQAQMEEAPFDYANAPSVLADEQGGKKGGRGKKQKGYDPYAKALDTSKGLPRRNQGTAGRSMTFKG